MENFLKKNAVAFIALGALTAIFSFYKLFFPLILIPGGLLLIAFGIFMLNPISRGGKIMRLIGFEFFAAASVYALIDMPWQP